MSSLIPPRSFLRELLCLTRVNSVLFNNFANIVNIVERIKKPESAMNSFRD